MKDIIGREIQLNDIVSATYMSKKPGLWRVVGFTPQRVSLVHLKDRYGTDHINKPPAEVTIIPDAVQLLAEKENEDER